MASTSYPSTRPVNESGRQPLPDGRPTTVDTAQPRSHSPRTLEGAELLLYFSRRAWEEYRARQARLAAHQGSPATRPPGDEAVAPGGSTDDSLEAPQQQAPQQEQDQQHARKSESTGHTDGSASSVLANSASRHPLPNSRPLPNSEPQPQRKRKRVEEEEDEEETEEHDEKKEKCGEKEEEDKKKKVDEKKKVDGEKTKDSEKKDDEKEASPDKPKPYACWCGKAYSRQDHLTRHMRGHGLKGKEGPPKFERFECDICQNLLTRRDNLKAHRKTKHPKAGSAPSPSPARVFVDARGKVIGRAEESSSEQPLKKSPTTSAATSPSPDAADGQSPLQAHLDPTGPVPRGFKAINK